MSAVAVVVIGGPPDDAIVTRAISSASILLA
jgi:hypothetical protein